MGVRHQFRCGAPLMGCASPPRRGGRRRDRLSHLADAGPPSRPSEAEAMGLGHRSGSSGRSSRSRSKHDDACSSSAGLLGRSVARERCGPKLLTRVWLTSIVTSICRSYDRTDLVAAFSLNGGCLSSPFVVRWRDAHFSFGAGGARSRMGAVPALNSRAGRQAARKQLELAGTRSVRRGGLGLKGSSRLSTCQQAISTLRATAALAGLDFPWRCLMLV